MNSSRSRDISDDWPMLAQDKTPPTTVSSSPDAPTAPDQGRDETANATMNQTTPTVPAQPNATSTSPPRPLRDLLQGQRDEGGIDTEEARLARAGKKPLRSPTSDTQPLPDSPTSRSGDPRASTTQQKSDTSTSQDTSDAGGSIRRHTREDSLLNGSSSSISRASSSSQLPLIPEGRRPPVSEPPSQQPSKQSPAVDKDLFKNGANNPPYDLSVGSATSTLRKDADQSSSWLVISWKDFRREFYGTFLMMTLGMAASAQSLLSKNQKGDYVGVCWGWGIGNMLGLMVAGVNDAHLNTAVTITRLALRSFPKQRVLGYVAGQICAGFLAAAVVYGLFHSSIDQYETGKRTIQGDLATATIFAAVPVDHMTTGDSILAELFASGLMMFVSLAWESYIPHSEKPDITTAIIGFLTTFGMGIGLSWQTGYIASNSSLQEKADYINRCAVNIARDMGPRFVAVAIGYGWDMFRVKDHFFCIPWFAPFLGCFVGGILYDIWLNSDGTTPVCRLKRRCWNRFCDWAKAWANYDCTRYNSNAC